MHYPCSENKGADQLRISCNHEADLRICLRIYKKPVCSMKQFLKVEKMIFLDVKM